MYKKVLVALLAVIIIAGLLQINLNLQPVIANGDLPSLSTALYSVGNESNTVAPDTYYYSYNNPVTQNYSDIAPILESNSAAALTILTVSLKDADTAASYHQTFQAANGVPPYKWAISGRWPPGLTLANNGVLWGTPIQSSKIAQVYSFVITVTDSAPRGRVQSFSKIFSITVYPQLDIASLPNADAGSLYYCKVSPLGGKPPYSLARGAAWPAWLTLNSSSATLSGTPLTRGTCKIGLVLTDSLGVSLWKTQTISINSPLQILTTALPNGKPGLVYPSTTLVASGGSGARSWSKTAGNWPSGLSLSASGTINGKPAPGSSGVYSVTLQVNDGIASVIKTFSIIIEGPLTISPLPDGVVGAPYSQVLSASGGSGGYRFSLAEVLPAWLAFNPGTANLYGAPMAAAVYNLAFKVTDSSGSTVVQNMTLTIASAGGGAISEGDFDIGTPVLKYLWVDPKNGNDNNGGISRQDALRTVAAAWARIPTGATLSSTGYCIQLVPGIYPLDYLPSWMENRHGSLHCPVIIKAADAAGTVLFTGGLNIFNCEYLYLIGLNIVPNPAGDALHFERCSHVLMRQVLLNSNGAAQETLKANQCSYFYVEECDIAGSYGAALDFVAVQYGHILRSRVHAAGDWCMYLKGGSAYFLIEGNELYNGDTGGFTAGQGTGFEFMVSPWLHYEAYDIKFINNIIHDTNGAGMGVNGGYNILMAFNTLYRVGQRSHAIEVNFGLRGCDGDTARCQANLAAGGWGTFKLGPQEPIPNRNVFIYNNIVYNPPGYRSEWNQFSIQGPQTPSQGTNIPSPATTDNNLQIRGNIIFNGPPDLPLGVGEPGEGGQASNPTCNANLLRAQNAFNTFQPQMVNPAGGNFSPSAGSNILSYLAQPIPDFSWSDAPSRPAVPMGQLSNSVTRNRGGVLRTAPSHPGAY